MKLEKISAVAELVSAIAIVVTLGYLALEMGQNTRSVQASVRQAMLAEDRELVFKQMEYPFVSPYLYGTRELTDEEKIQLSAWLIVFLRGRENHWLQFQSGVIDQTTWEAYRAPLRTVLLKEPAKSFWRIRSKRNEYAAGFVVYVNDFLSGASDRQGFTLDQELGFSE
jgi:hypothetical protein